MEVNRLVKWGVTIVCMMIGTIYLASAILVSERISGWFDFRKPYAPFRIEAQNLHDAETGQKSKPEITVVEIKSSNALFLGAIPKVVGIAAFAIITAIPLLVFYCLLLRPLREIPIVTSRCIKELDSSDENERETAAIAIADAMRNAEDCPEVELEELITGIERSENIVEIVKDLLQRREGEAKKKAIEIATMAGLTVAASSSALGDGLGMFFWKSKLVYETFRIYGFRPDIRTTVSIWVHVIFASFFAASVEELCELFDVSELIGGIKTRALQGFVGAVVLLKGGELARAYLTGGISAETRHRALSDFRASAADDLKEVAFKVAKSLKKIGLKVFSWYEDETEDVA